MTRYGFLGAGNMAQAMIKGLLNAGISAQDILVASPHSAAKLAKELGIQALDSTELLQTADLVTLAFLPKQLTAISQSLPANLYQNKLLVSVIGDVNLNSLGTAFPGAQIVRTLPNVNVSINRGMTSYALATNLTAASQTAALAFLDLLGSRIELAESNFAVFSALAGSSPAYVFAFIQSLAQAGQQNGLSAQDALTIAAQTVLGSAQTLLASDSDPASLIASVASPGGSTEAGLKALSADKFNEVVIHGIQATIDHQHE